MIAVAGNASDYQAYPVSRISGEGRAELKKQKQNLGAGGEKKGRAGEVLYVVSLLQQQHVLYKPEH